MSSRLRLLLLLVFGICASPCLGIELVVLEARGGELKSGMRIDSTTPLALKEGERVTMIGPDGRSVTLRGPYRGPAFSTALSVSDPRQALAALLAVRDTRTSSIGSIRAGAAAARIAEPWLIDVTHQGGARCLRQGEDPVWWRADSQVADQFTLFPLDRSWSAQFSWKAGEKRQAVPPLVRYKDNTTFLIRHHEHEYALNLIVIPNSLANPMMLSSWMLEKGCLQQAEALLERMRAELLPAQ